MTTGAFARIAIVVGTALAGLAADGPASAPAVERVQEPKAVAIIHRYVEVTGGQAAYERVHTREMTATLTVPLLKLKGTRVVKAKAPDKVYFSVELSGRPKTETGYDGSVGWTRLANRPPRKLEGAQLLQVKALAGFNTAANAEKMYSTIRMAPPLPGDGLLDGKAVDRIELVSEAEAVVQTYERDTGLLIRSEQKDPTARGDQMIVSDYTDYRTEDGVKYPHHTKTTVGQIVLEQDITEIKHNAEIPDSVFEMPTGDAR